MDPADTVWFKWDFSVWLEPNEVLTGTPTMSAYPAWRVRQQRHDCQRCHRCRRHRLFGCNRYLQRHLLSLHNVSTRNGKAQPSGVGDQPMTCENPSQASCALLNEKIRAIDILVTEKFRARDETRILLVNTINDKFQARDIALTTAFTTMERRLESMNEFRATLSEQQANLMPRTEYSVRHDQLTAEIKRAADEHTKFADKLTMDKLEARVLVSETRLATWDGRLWAIGTLFILLNVFISWYLHSGPISLPGVSN